MDIKLRGLTGYICNHFVFEQDLTFPNPRIYSEILLGDKHTINWVKKLDGKINRTIWFRFSPQNHTIFTSNSFRKVGGMLNEVKSIVEWLLTFFNLGTHTKLHKFRRWDQTTFGSHFHHLNGMALLIVMESRWYIKEILHILDSTQNSHSFSTRKYVLVGEIVFLTLGKGNWTEMLYLNTNYLHIVLSKTILLVRESLSSDFSKKPVVIV